MPTPVVIPVLNENDETVKLVEWLKADGEQVRQGQYVLVVETSKAALEVEAPVAGILRTIVGAGTHVRMPATVGWILATVAEAVPASIADATSGGEEHSLRLTKKAEELLAEHGVSRDELPADWTGVVRLQQVEEFLKSRG